MSTGGEIVTLDDFSTADSSPQPITRDWVSEHTDIDVEEFDSLGEDEQRHILWDLSRDVPFRYANHAHHAKMRQYLAGGVVVRCKAPTILFRAFPRITEFRQRRGRPSCEYRGGDVKLYVDFSTRAAASDYGVKESDIAHELLHAILYTNQYGLDSRAFVRDGRTDRAWYHNGGFPNWDFGGEDVPASTYFIRDQSEHDGDADSAAPVVGDLGTFDSILSKRIAAYDGDGLAETIEQKHAPTTRPNPFAENVDVDTPESDDEKLRRLVREANLAWYTTAMAFSLGSEEFARNAIIRKEYTATNPSEMVCVLHEVLQSPGHSAGVTKYLVQAYERHPWLLKRYLDVYQPHPDKQENLEIVL